jgi:nucleotide-binding universal stress UspA family protein
MTERVVVGLDVSPTAEAALDWALEAAASSGAEVSAVHTWHWDVPDSVSIPPDERDRIADAVRTAVDGQLERARARRPAGARSVSATACTVEGDPGRVLVAAAADAALLVVGRHGQSAVSRRLVGQVLGSVVATCLNRSTAPVVVVPDGAPATAPARVVVGVDGSDASVRALQWAHGHASTVGSRLVAVLTWQLTTLPAPSSFTAGAVPPLPEWQAKAERVLSGVCTAALGADAPDLEQVVLHEPAAAGLLGAVSERDLLVLGDRGRGGFSRLLLGSVSRQCAEHAPCPVVVVPPRDRPGAVGD